MTGEMSWIKPNGEAGDGCVYELHAAVAKALGCELRPFDTYIGPYIAHPAGRIWISVEDGIGEICLWPGGVAPAYCDPIVSEFCPLATESAIFAAHEVIARAEAA